MSGPLGSSQFMYATGAEGGQSLRFEDGDSAYLSRTPASAGNRKTWTWSGWVKLGNVGATHWLWAASTSTAQYSIVRINSTGTIEYARIVSSAINAQKISNRVLRDPSAWYHIVVVEDATNTDAKIYVNGSEVSYATNNNPTNVDGAINSTGSHIISGLLSGIGGAYIDGYLANVAFIDGQALTPTSFGEYEDTLWRPKSDADITDNLTFGTNGFYLPFKQTTEAEGFSTVTYTGNGSTHGIEGVGFEPDLVWLKSRSAYSHNLSDSVRGGGVGLTSNSTAAEYSISPANTFDSDGFTLNKTNNQYNASGVNYVAWCWDAGTGSAASNTDGSITSSVKANTAKGFSVVSYTSPNNSSDQTVGHGLSQAPDMIICKNRDRSYNWDIYHSGTGNVEETLIFTTAATRNVDAFTTTAPTSTVFGTKNTYTHNGTDDYIAYCFHSVSNYSSIGSYSGTGAAGNSITGLGFKPAWVMIKDSTNSGNSWVILDNTRDTTDPRESGLFPDGSYAEADLTTGYISSFDADGFTVAGSGGAINTSGATMIYMAFADTRDATFFGDTSGNGNNWTPNALNNTDVVPDSPVTNFATYNSILNTALTLSEGNLEAVYSSAAWRTTSATFYVSSGKWYWETRNTGNDYHMVGIVADSFSTYSNHVGKTADSYSYYNWASSGSAGNKYNNNVATSYGAQWAAGDIIGVALDLDAGTIEFYKNNVSQGVAFTGISGTYAPAESLWTSSSIANFGQDSSFAGLETPQGNTDDNGQGDFYYAPPSGFLALTRNNLPTLTITAPDEYFNTLLYTGTGSSLSVTGANFQPDFLWIKNRQSTPSHVLQDSIRGAGKSLFSNATSDELGDSGDLIASFDSDGFSVNDTFLGGSGGGATNGSGVSYVAWNWLAGGTAVSNTDGSGTSQVSANTDAGFSVVSYTGNASGASDDQTLGHGLTNAPEIMFVKTRDEARDWYVYCKYLSNSSDYFLKLNTTAAEITTSVDAWNGTDPTSSVFSVGYEFNTNRNGYNYIAYCFHSVENYSLISSYTGNGSTDGTYVHCGFRPAWVIVKRADSTSNWLILDNKREGYNPDQDGLDANGSGSEGTAEQSDFLSNGFKVRNNSSGSNASGGTFIFLAFAEAPFRNANAR